tara:strand:- start:41057 stop:42205 length:1149 start_codon:yes stop_codon:yes gene_type:complete
MKKSPSFVTAGLLLMTPPAFSNQCNTLFRANNSVVFTMDTEDSLELSIPTISSRLKRWIRSGKKTDDLPVPERHRYLLSLRAEIEHRQHFLTKQWLKLTKTTPNETKWSATDLSQLKAHLELLLKEMEDFVDELKLIEPVETTLSLLDHYAEIYTILASFRAEDFDPRRSEALKTLTNNDLDNLTTYSSINRLHNSHIALFFPTTINPSKELYNRAMEDGIFLVYTEVGFNNSPHQVSRRSPKDNYQHSEVLWNKYIKSFEDTLSVEEVVLRNSDIQNFLVEFNNQFKSQPGNQTEPIHKAAHWILFNAYRRHHFVFPSAENTILEVKEGIMSAENNYGLTHFKESELVAHFGSEYKSIFDQALSEILDVAFRYLETKKATP